MQLSYIMLIFIIPFIVAVMGGIFYLFYLICRALKKYTEGKSPLKEDEGNKSKGNILKDLRIKNHMTQEFIAESIGVTRQAVSKWETGKAEPSYENLASLAKLFNMKYEDLLELLKNK